MRSSVASSALAVAFVLTPMAAGHAPSLCQDFSITNQESGDAWRRDVMRQLQAWWDVHAYYPRHASNNDEGGIVKVHLEILSDGRIWTSNVVASSGSRSLDAAGAVVFREGIVRPFPAGAPKADIDLSLHYVLAHRHDEPVPAGYTPVLSKSPFTIMNDPVKSPILETMLQRTCTGTVVRNGVKNHPWFGRRSWAQAIFFRKPDGTPWVKFYEARYTNLSPVTEVGKAVQWTVEEGHGSARHGNPIHYTLWRDGDNHLTGAYGSLVVDGLGVAYSNNIGGPVDFTCTTEILPSITWNDWAAQTLFAPPGDPP